MAVDPARAKSLFLAASDVNDPVARAAYLNRECGRDAELLARVEALLRANDDSPLPPAEAAGVAPTHVATLPPQTEDFGDPHAVSGTIVAGKYKLLQQIGEGGMGTVWMADQTEPVKRRVAVKLIRTERGQSKTILSRFEAERQAIALMDHPHIAKLLDAGTTETGAPFFVMELVKGMPLTEYCDAHRLSIQNRLSLFMQICSAVQHAHQKGIIHRDLKPTNILVESHDGKPVPKVIDFGLAKATSGLKLTENTLFTGFGMVMGTPLYMAPEQANFNALDIDTRADVYALGVILYELLTGSTPLSRDTMRKAAMDEMLRLVREQEAPTPSSRLSSSDAKPTVAANRQMEPVKLGHLVKGELDWIVLKALSKERDRRYETANGFASDIGRFLMHEPVLAGPPSTSYRLRKFVRRNRLQVIAAGLVLLTLVAGVVGTTLALFEAQRQKGIAFAEVEKKEQARRKTREALDTLTSDALSEWFTREQSLSPVQTDVLRRLLGQYAAFAEEGGDAADDRKGQVRALVRVGRIQRALGDRPAAGAALRHAAELAGTAKSPITADADGWDLVTIANNELAMLNQGESSHGDAEVHYREALAAQIRVQQADPDRHNARISANGLRVSLAGVLSDLERFDEADEAQRAAEAELEQLVVEFPRQTVLRENLAILLFNRARTFNIRGRLPEALVLNGRAVELLRRAAAEEPGMLRPQKTLVMGLRQQSELLDSALRLPEAERVRREVIGIGFSLSASFPAVLEYRVNLAADYCSLSHHLAGQGRNDDAEDAAGRGVAVIRQVVADFPDNPIVGADLMMELIEFNVALLGTQKFKEAESAAREALAQGDRLATLGFDPDGLRFRRAKAMRALAIALQRQGRHADSRVATKEQLNDLARLAVDHPDRTDYLQFLCIGRIDSAHSLIGQREADAAIEELQAVLPDLDRLPVADRERLRWPAVFEMAKAYGVVGRWTESEEWAGQAVEAYSDRRRQNPEFQEYRGFLTQSHWHRAIARDQLGRHADAATDWGAAADLADNPMDKAFYLAHRGDSLARGGDAENAATEFAAAIHQAESVLKASDLTGITYYDAAAVYAFAASGLTDPVAVETHAAEAVRLLGRAAAVGYLGDAAQVKTLIADDAYSALHARPDFKQFLSDLNQKAPPR